MRNAVSICSELTPIRFSQLSAGQMYQYISGAAVYMKIDGGYGVHLGTGEKYYPEAHKNVRVISEGITVNITSNFNKCTT